MLEYEQNSYSRIKLHEIQCHFHGNTLAVLKKDRGQVFILDK